MPTLTRLYVKTSLFYLVAALVLALVFGLAQATTLPPLLAAAGPVYLHLFMVGWIMQLIMGIVFWMFPKYSRRDRAGNEWLAVVIYGLLNAGLLLRVVGEPARAVSPAACCGDGCWRSRRCSNGWPGRILWLTPGAGLRSAEMPRPSVWFIRLALSYLLVGFTFACLLLSNKGLAYAPWLWRLLPAHIEILLVGWTAQLAMGVIFWIAPRFQSSCG